MAERVLFRQDGAEARTVVLEPALDGGCRLVAYDRGETAEATFGRPDHEFGVSIAGADMARLCLALLEQHFQGRSSAVDDLAAICGRFGIPCERGSW